MKYNPVSPEIVEELKNVLGEKFVKTDEDTLDKYKMDEVRDPKFWRLPEVVVLPGSTEEVSAVMKIANKYHIPVTPRSAGTSLCCGAVPVYHGIVLLMERFNKILEINDEGMYMVVEAGVRTIDVQQAANARGLMYAGDPCSSDSCFIGGNLATNAGGDKAVRYGTTRHQVYSIEVVLPSGEVTTLGATLKKCTTGFCMDQLVIGSEGTLGIITKATLKLVPLAPYRLDVLAVFDDLAKATSLVPILVRAGLNPTSVEFMDTNFIRSSCEYSKVRLPHCDDGFYDIVTIETYNEDELDSKMEKLEELCMQSGATDVLEADDRIWMVRRNALESTRELSKITSSADVVVPVTKIADCIQAYVEESKKYDYRVFCLAHAGDGNLHFRMLKCDMDDGLWKEQIQKFYKFAYKYAYELGGRLSGEHGIGMKRIDYMKEYTDPVELKMMVTIKNALDPNWILNPGKVFSVPE